MSSAQFYLWPLGWLLLPLLGTGNANRPFFPVWGRRLSSPRTNSSHALSPSVSQESLFSKAFCLVPPYQLLASLEHARLKGMRLLGQGHRLFAWGLDSWEVSDVTSLTLAAGVTAWLLPATLFVPHIPLTVSLIPAITLAQIMPALSLLPPLLKLPATSVCLCAYRMEREGRTGRREVGCGREQWAQCAQILPVTHLCGMFHWPTS